MSKKQLDPNDYDDDEQDEFISDCVDEIGNEDVCQMLWDGRSTKALKHKTHAAKVAGMEYVLSDETPDRMDDVIMSDGWVLDNFKKNPIALFGHSSTFPIGKWSNLRVEDKQLKGKLELAPKGTSARIDEIRSLVDADVLRAVSVGFRPLESRPREESKWGSFFTKSELVETSLVAVPANPNALAVAKSLNISPSTLKMVFAGQGNGGRRMERRELNGGQADRRRDQITPKGKNMSVLAQRITDAEQRLLEARNALEVHLETVDDSNISDSQVEATSNLNNQIVQRERTLNVLRDSERNLAASSENPQRQQLVVVSSRNVTTNVAAPAVHNARPFAMAAKKIDPVDLLARIGVAMMYARVQNKPIDVARRELFGEDEVTKAMFEWNMRAATAPAMTTVPGWAAELSQTIYSGFMALLTPASVYPRLSGYGMSLTFGTAGKIVIPTRSRTPTIAGSFVGEGLPIPVRQGAFTAQTLVPKKMAVITTWTREIDEHSAPAIQGILRQAIQEDTAVSMDTVLLDTNPATAVRPAGILNGITPLTPTAGGGFTAVVGDIKGLTGSLLTGTLGNIRSPVYIMNPIQVNSLGLIAAPGVGAFPFREEVAAGNLGGWPIISSGTVPAGTVVAVDAADFVSVGGEAPRFEVSDQATLHMEDTAPADIVSGAAPGTPANPVKSMWQTDSLALRLILPTNWTIRRAGVVAAVVGVTW
jgi:HK97 family phage prohead protease